MAQRISVSAVTQLADDLPALSGLSSVDYHYRVAGRGRIETVHPGTTVRQDCIEKNGLSVTDAARILGVDRQTLSNLLNARSGISPEMAVRLEKAFGTPAREWLIRQLDYELAEVMRRAKKIKVEPFRPTITEDGGNDERRRD
jgi:addiction module HigA family antidote